MHAAPGQAAEYESAALTLHLLGPMELHAGGELVALPRSKKTRALLAYLAVSERAHRRDRLCALLWDVTDDPRGALRWSLSRLRAALGDDTGRITADNQEVSLSTAGIAIDLQELARLQREGFATVATGVLERAAALVRGEFLEGLELPDFLDFSAWCIEQREQARRCHCELLAELVSRLSDEAPERALPYARQRTQVDVFDLGAHKDLLGLLLRLGHLGEAERRFEQSQRVLRQASAPTAIAFDQAWRALRGHSAGAAAAVPVSAVPIVETVTTQELMAPSFVGRDAVVAELEALLAQARHARATQLALVTGEPGVGKSRLADRLRVHAESAGFVVVAGRAFEAESARPFGPWADALGVNVQATVASDLPVSREGLFDLLRERLASLARQGEGLLLVMDDLQWFDRNSAELLHVLVRSDFSGAMLVLMLARGGELPDNEAATRMLRSLRRERAVRQIDLAPLTRDEIGALVGAEPTVDAERVHAVSAGNPLYAIELVRAQRDGVAGTPATLLQLVRDRVERLPDGAADVLRWAAVVGHAVDLVRLEALVAQPADELVDALERLERSSLLRVDATRVRERYVFAHDLIREAVYGELSQPRRRLMHRKVALMLEPLAADPAVAAELARHASLAGEAPLGVRACIAAGQHALRVFANGDAEELARSGLRLAEELDEAARIEATLELMQVLYTARTPDREEAAVCVRSLAERALDLGLTRTARQGFQMVSYLRWEHSLLADAHANILQAERVSRLAAEPGERAVALAQAARCLLLLERNLQQAEAFVLEADAARRREGRTSAAVSFALGMIAAHRGDAEAAVDAFVEARSLARQQGEHLAEFGALEHHVMLEIDRGQRECAVELAHDLAELGRRVRPGAEMQIGQALLALARQQSGTDGAADDAALHEAVEAVRRADAKFELSYLLTRRAEQLLDDGRLRESRGVAVDALEVSEAIGRSSEVVHSLAVLAQAARRLHNLGEVRQWILRLEPLAAKDLSARSRQRIDAVRAAYSTRRGRQPE